jgi:hypothetical protein
LNHIYNTIYLFDFSYPTIVFWPLGIIPADFTHSRSSKRKVFHDSNADTHGRLSHTLPFYHLFETDDGLAMCDDSFVPTCILSLARLLVNKACLDRVELLMDLEGGCGGLVVESLFWRDLEVVWGKEE